MELLLAILYYFRQMFGNITINGVFLSGNADLLYILSIYYFAFYLFKRETENHKKQLFLWIIPLIIYGLLQFFILGDVSIIKMGVNIGKIMLCIGVMYLTIGNIRKFNFKKFLIYCTGLYLVSIPLAFVLRNSILWRNNDLINKYSLSRLNLLYMEPSELGFHVAVLIIMLIAVVLHEKNKKNIKLFSGAIVVNLIVLSLARSWGSIVVLVVSLMLMFFAYMVLNPSRKAFKIGGIVFAIIIAGGIFSAATKNPIYMRAMDTLQGKDLSNWYRINASVRLTNMMFKDTHGLGLGMGNMNTSLAREKYQIWGLVSVIPNSFLYEIAETGVLAILAIWGIIASLIYKCFRERSVLKWGLLCFVVLYQIFGGHFTNPLNWIIYGFIFSNFKETDLDEEIL